MSGGARRLGVRDPGDEHRYRQCAYRDSRPRDIPKPLRRPTEAEQEAAYQRLQVMVKEASNRK